MASLSVTLASTSLLKREAVKRVLDQLGIPLVQEYVEHTTTKAQPVGESEVLEAGMMRIHNVLHDRPASNWIVVLENGLVKRKGEWYDDCVCIVYSTKRGDTIHQWTKNKIPLHNSGNVLQAYFELGQTDTLTFGKYLCDTMGLPEEDANNWMKVLGGTDRVDQMVDAVRGVFSSEMFVSDVATGWIRSINDYPKEGIVFKDLMPLLYNPVARNCLVYRMTKLVEEISPKIDVIMGPELRGCVFGPLVAMMMNLPFVPLRKKGKLPPPTKSIEYGKEYGTDSIEVDDSNFFPLKDKQVVLIDDVLATGGSLKACAELVESLGAVVTGMIVIQSVEALQEEAEQKLGRYDVRQVLGN